MSIFDGQPVDAAVSNPSWISKNTDDTTPSKLGLGNSDPISGTMITNAQRELNSIDSFIGKIQNTPATALPPWTHNDVGTSIDPLFQRADATTVKFNPASGHRHTGAPGDAPPLPASSISNSPVTPSPVASISVVGTSGSGLAWGDHVHEGLHSIAAFGNPAIKGDAILTGGTGVSLSQTGSTITVSATGSGGGGSTVIAPINNDQLLPTNVSGFFVNPASAFGFEAEYSLCRSRTATSISQDGTFYTNLGTAFPAEVVATASQHDGKDLVGGNFTTFNGNTRNRLVRLNLSGTEDTTFYTNLGTAFNNPVNAIAVQNDGKILVGGQFTSFNGNTRNRLVRLNSDGTEDGAFYTNLGTAFAATVYAIQIQTDGKILVGFNGFGGSAFNGNGVAGLVRLNSDGTEDTSFSANITAGFNDAVLAIAVQPDGRVVLGGAFTTFKGSTRNSIVRVFTSGIEDFFFYLNLGTGFSASVQTLAVQKNGGVLVGGTFTALNGNTRNFIVRLGFDGVEDLAFYTNLGGSFNASIFSIALQEDKIIVGGGFSVLDVNSRNRIARLNPDGTDDSAFYTPFGTGFTGGIVSFILLQKNGDILIAGDFNSLNGSTRNRLVRFFGDYAATDFVEQGSIRAVYRPTVTTWSLGGLTSIGDDVGVTFSITNGGQLQYVSTAVPGALTTSEMHFALTSL